MFKNLKIRDKLFSAFGLALILLMLCGGLFFVAINGMTNNFTTFHDEAFELSNETYALKAEITQLSNSICKSVMSPDKQSAEKYIEETETQVALLEERIAHLREHSFSEAFITKLDELQSTWKRLQRLLSRVRPLSSPEVLTFSAL